MLDNFGNGGIMKKRIQLSVLAVWRQKCCKKLSRNNPFRIWMWIQAIWKMMMTTL